MWIEIAIATGFTAFWIIGAYWCRRSVAKLGQTISTVTATVCALLAVEWLFYTLYLLAIPATQRQNAESQQVIRTLGAPLIGPIPLGFIVAFYWLSRLWQKPVPSAD